MASFNLGSIRGPKGDKGDTGEKGGTGAAGRTGAKGTDGNTPVFEVAGVETVDSCMGANVYVDSSAPENPKLYFSIPKGKDGKDASGDMNKSIYDTAGISEDIYRFSEKLFEKALPISGGILSGKLKAYISPLEEGCVRNILFSPTLPQSGSDGEICFLKSNNTRTLYENPIGSVLLLQEGEKTEEYIVIAKDFHAEGGVTVVRKYVLDNFSYFDYNGRDSYFLSDIDMYLNSVFVRRFSNAVRKGLIWAELDDYDKRTCFLPSTRDIRAIEYFKDNPFGTVTKSGKSWNAMTRTLDDINRVLCATTTGTTISQRQREKLSVRPMLVLPGGLEVVNVIESSNSAMRLCVETEGIYFCENGIWKELTV